MKARPRRDPAFLLWLVVPIVMSMTCSTSTAFAASQGREMAGIEALGGVRPRLVSSSIAAADTFLATNFRFDADGNSGTVIDTVLIKVGQAILWQSVSGFHTTTSGNGNADPQAGMLWDRPIDASQPTFSFQFNSTGTFPFFCRPHEFTMKGVVVVQTPTDAPGSAREGHVGFVQGPSPNPARSGVHYRITLAEPGPVLVEVFDDAGRRIAIVLSRRLEAGTHAGSWNARATNEARVSSGRYFLRLRAHGIDQSRAFAITR